MVRLHSRWLLAAIAFVLAPFTMGQYSYGPSAYRLERWDEDYSALKDPAYRKDPFDPLKYIDLGGEAYLSLGGQARYRYDYFNNPNFGKGVSDEDGFHLVRLLAHADLHVNKSFRAFLQLDSGMIDNKEGGPRVGDADEIDIQQAFFDFNFDIDPRNSIMIRAGRQELAYGAQRLVSPDDWGNVRRTFEGVKISWAADDHITELFWVRPVTVLKERLNNGDGDVSFAGIYHVSALPMLFAPGDSKLDLYFLALNQSGATDRDTYTLGSRFHTTPRPWDFDVEVDWQFGDLESDSICAYSIAAELGYTWESAPCSPRGWVGFDLASGSANGTGTFNQLFPPQYLYLGHLYVLARENVIDAHGGLTLHLTRDINLSAEQHFFWRQNTAGPIFGIKGDLLRADSGSDAAPIGNELDVWMTWQIQRHISAYIGYAHFFSGDFIHDADAGRDKDIDFFYASMTFTF